MNNDPRYPGYPLQERKAMPDKPVEQTVTINGAQVVALVGVFMQASDAIPEPALEAVINQLLTEERQARLDPRVPPGTEETIRTNRKAIELFRTMKAGLRALRETPAIVTNAPTLLHGGRA